MRKTHCINDERMKESGREKERVANAFDQSTNKIIQRME